MPDYSQTETCPQGPIEQLSECSNQTEAGSPEQAYLMNMQNIGMGNTMAQESIPTYGPPAPEYLLECHQETYATYGPPAPSEEELRSSECGTDSFFQSPEEYREWYDWDGPFTSEDGTRYAFIEQFLIQSDDPEAWRVMLARSARKQHENALWQKEQEQSLREYEDNQSMRRSQKQEELQQHFIQHGQDIGDMAESVSQYGSTYIMNIDQQEVKLPPSIESIVGMACLVENNLLLRSRIAATPEGSPLNGTALTRDGVTQSIKFALGDVFSGLSLGISDNNQVTMRGTIGGEWATASLEYKALNKYICRFEPKKLIELSHGGWKFKIRLDASLVKTYYPEGGNDIDLQPLNISPETQLIVLGSAGLLLAAAAMLTGTGEVALAGAAGLALFGIGSTSSLEEKEAEATYQ